MGPLDDRVETKRQCIDEMRFPKTRLDTREKAISFKVRRVLEGDDLLES